LEEPRKLVLHPGGSQTSQLSAVQSDETTMRCLCLLLVQIAAMQSVTGFLPLVCFQPFLGAAFAISVPEFDFVFLHYAICILPESA
jgi:hypothetical protein